MFTNLGSKILEESINKRIAFINSRCPRNFDFKIDILKFALTPTQFKVIEEDFNLKSYHIIGRGVEYEDFNWKDYNIHTFYNDRIGVYEFAVKHKDYLEDLEEREEYFDNNY